MCTSLSFNYLRLPVMRNPRLYFLAALTAAVSVFPKSVQAQSFTRITGTDLTSESFQSLGVAWGDYDDDGYVDLFIANGGQRNSLFHNNGDGTFSRISTGVFAEDIGDSRGSLWADYDNDGDLDLYVSNRGGNVPPTATDRGNPACSL